MTIYEVLIAILDKPNVPKFYRDLKNHYKNNGMLQEELAIQHLLEKKFDRKIDDTHSDSK